MLIECRVVDQKSEWIIRKMSRDEKEVVPKPKYAPVLVDIYDNPNWATLSAKEQSVKIDQELEPVAPRC